MSTTKKPTFIDARRRGFLQGAAIAGGTVASAGVVNADVLPEVEPSAPVVEPQKGYKRTEHVERYYARARF